MFADGGNLAFIEYDDLVGIHHRADALRDHEGSATLHQFIERSLDQGFSAKIDT